MQFSSVAVSPLWSYRTPNNNILIAQHTLENYSLGFYNCPRGVNM